MKSIIALVAIVFLVVLGTEIYYHTTQEVIKIKVTDKEVVVTGNAESTSSKYLIMTEDEVFENEDEFIRLKFNSSDVQNKLKVDSTYTVRVIGWRIPFLSTYRNIIEIK